jgi:hypothetical protein
VPLLPLTNKGKPQEDNADHEGEAIASLTNDADPVEQATGKFMRVIGGVAQGATIQRATAQSAEMIVDQDSGVNNPLLHSSTPPQTTMANEPTTETSTKDEPVHKDSDSDLTEFWRKLEELEEMAEKVFKKPVSAMQMMTMEGAITTPFEFLGRMLISVAEDRERGNGLPKNGNTEDEEGSEAKDGDTDAKEENKCVPFPFPQDAFLAVKTAVQRLCKYKQDDPIDRDELKFLLGEFLITTSTIGAKLERLEEDGDNGIDFKAMMPFGMLKQRSERRRARFFASALELFNEITDVLFLPILYREEIWLFAISLTFMVLSVLGRLYSALKLRKNVEPKKFTRYIYGMLLSLVEPHSGLIMMKQTLKDNEAGAKRYVEDEGEFGRTVMKAIRRSKDAVAVQAHMDLDAGKAEQSNMLVMIFGEDVPEFAVEVAYLLLDSIGNRKIGLVWALSTAGTALHLVFTLMEYRLNQKALPLLKRVAESREKVFEDVADDGDDSDDSDYDDDDIVTFDEDVKDFVDGLERTSSLGFVRTVSLYSCVAITDASVGHLARCTQLQSLDLWMCMPVTDAGLAHLSRCAQLQSLSVAGCEVTDAGLAHISRCAQLQSLDVSHCDEVTDVGLAHVSRCAQLQSLDVSYCDEVTDSGLAYVSRCTQLQSLNVSYCDEVTDVGLALVSRCAQLQSLTVEGCKKVSSLRWAYDGQLGPAEIKKLRNTKIFSTGII